MRKEKQLLLDEIREKIEGNPALIVTRYSKWSAGTVHRFRNEVRAKGAEFEVVRKRLFQKAAAAVGISIPEEWLVGHIGVVFIHGDPLVAAKGVDQFSQDNESVLEIVGGRLDGQVMSGADVVVLAKLPSMNELRAQLLGLLQAPMAHVLAVMEAFEKSAAESAESKASEG